MVWVLVPASGDRRKWVWLMVVACDKGVKLNTKTKQNMIKDEKLMHTKIKQNKGCKIVAY